MIETLQQKQIKIGDTVEGEVYKVTSFGAFIKLPYGKRGLVHISQISDSFVKDISEHIKLGDKIKVRIIAIDGNKIDLTLKKPEDLASFHPENKDFKSSDLEDKLNNFLRGRAAR